MAKKNSILKLKPKEFFTLNVFPLSLLGKDIAFIFNIKISFYTYIEKLFKIKHSKYFNMYLVKCQKPYKEQVL